MIKLSAGTAHVLGIRKLAIDTLPTTAYMMSGERCIHDCGFCPQARNASSRTDLLSRVTWTQCRIEDTVHKIKAAHGEGKLQRACLQVVDGRKAIEQVKAMVNHIRDYSDIPICVSAKVNHREEILALAEAGVDRIGLALDAACERVYNLTKSGSWQDTLNFISDAAGLLPSRISTHLIVGLGETEQEMINIIRYMRELGVTVGLFAFTPVPGTRMVGMKPPDLDCYRRMQAANYLMDIIPAGDCRFNSGRLIDYGLTAEMLTEYLKDGKAFETSGCPGCNRPYYNEKPGGVIYNYPRPLTEPEIDEAIDLVIKSLDGRL